MVAPRRQLRLFQIACVLVLLTSIRVSFMVQGTTSDIRSIQGVMTALALVCAVQGLALRRKISRQFAVAVVFICVSTMVIAQNKTGVICVAPIKHEPPTTAATPEVACVSGNFSFRIDSGRLVAWPKDESMSLTGLDLKMRHRVLVLCDGRPQQSFRFRMSEYKTGKACLFLNDLYLTAQLWEPKQAPWCTCRP
jgi:hypothetical protein